ncbi:hypothetical protein ACFYNY_34095 [Streptomyces sp. NPDC006530]|uniref:hypothetical protein n=1 Tax=Streptomyces sp. NPDC006530 TaxID=3364750 RepID=UPI0036BF161F
MNRRTLTPAVAALTAVLALALGACGSGDEHPKDSDKIVGADQSSKPSPSPSASSASPAADRPAIELPADVKDTFDPSTANDPVQNAVLADNAEFVRALDAAISAGNPRLPALEYYTEGPGAVAANKWVKGFTDAGWTVTGSTRYFHRTVTVHSPTTASLSYCGDESQAFSKVVKTGEVKKTPTTKDSYVAYGVQVTKNAKGVWEVIDIKSTRGAASCRP